MDFEVRQIVIAHEVMWEAITEWVGKRNLRLVRIPGSGESDDDVPTYVFSPINFDNNRDRDFNWPGRRDKLGPFR